MEGGWKDRGSLKRPSDDEEVSGEANDNGGSDNGSSAVKK
jgi:hypothetical protein